MIYPTMIGFKPQEIFNISHGRLMFSVALLNFILVPLLAYGLGTAFLLRDPQLFTGLAITALLLSLEFLIQGQAAAWFIKLNDAITGL